MEHGDVQAGGQLAEGDVLNVGASVNSTTLSSRTKYSDDILARPYRKAERMGFAGAAGRESGREIVWPRESRRAS